MERILISEEQIKEKVKELAAELSRVQEGEKPAIGRCVKRSATIHG